MKKEKFNQQESLIIKIFNLRKKMHNKIISIINQKEVLEKQQQL